MNRGLSRARAYARTEVHNKIDSSIKRRLFYREYQMNEVTGKEATNDDIDIDIGAFTAAWPLKPTCINLRIAQLSEQVQ